MRIAALFAAALASSAIAATPPKPVAPLAPQISEPAPDLARCDQLLRSIDMDERAMAIVQGEQIGDNSAPRHTNRLLEINNTQQAQAMKLSIMIAMRCPSLPRGAPAQGEAYMPEGITCAGARFANHPDAKKECDIATWPPRASPN